MIYQIKVDYETGDSFHTEETYTVLPYKWETLDLAKLNLKRIKEYGGNVLMGRTSIGEHGFISIFIDSEGNRLALHSRL